MKRIIALIGIFSVCFSGFTQESQQNLIESMIEFVAENSDEEINAEELTETWEFFLENPVNLNKTTSEELHRLRILNELQIQSLLAFREKNGPLLSIYELQPIEGFDKDILEKLQPFVIFQESEIVQKKRNKLKQELMIRATRVAEKAKGFLEEEGFEGSPEKYYLRYKLSGERVNLGITAEKDPGEAFFRGSNSVGFDYTSFFGNYQSKNRKCRFFMGDYLVRVGQGLILWQGFGSGKSSEVTQTYKSNAGTSSYSSADENRFFRGLSAEMDMKHTRVTAFVSYKKVDANLETQSGETIITSLQTSGLHTTQNEVDDENAVREVVGGLAMTFQKNNFSAGVSAIHTWLDKRLVPDDRLSNQFLFTGKEIGNASVDYKWSVKKLFLFGELATSTTGGFAASNGVLLKPSDQLEISALYRNFSKKYNALYGQAISESSKVNDEEGFYIGARLWPLANVTLSAYHDFYHFRWLKSQTSSPSKGNETFLQLDYNPGKNIKTYLRYFIEEKESTTSGEQIKFNEGQQIQRMRLNFDFRLNGQIDLKSRAEFSSFGNEKGVLILQDIRYQSLKVPVTMQIRFAWFDTDSYNCRIYAYENDLLYNFSVPALSGQGTRFYLNGKWKITEKLDLWLKFARTQYVHQTLIGSGLSEIGGDQKTELKVQIRYQF